MVVVMLATGGMAQTSMKWSIEERYGSKSDVTRYAADHRGVRRLSNRGEKGWMSGINRFIKEAFLPQGYPSSVSEDYLAYQMWDTVQAFCSSITGTLATMAVLKGVGVGDSSATPLAATLTWMLKDGTGMLGRILFAWMNGSDLDCNAKRWRLVADILNDVATFLELLAPLFPTLFLYIVCVASVSKAVVGVAGGATRTALIQHQARRDNMADVAAKDGSQETLVNLAALLVGLVLTPAVAGWTEMIWLLFICFTTFHLIANHRAVSVVAMETLNKNRLHLVMCHYLSTGAMPPVNLVNAKEPILTRSTRALSYDLGCPLSLVLTNAEEYRHAVAAHRNSQKYIVRYQSSTKNVYAAFSQDSDTNVQLKVAMVIELMDYIINHSSSPVLHPLGVSLELLRGNEAELISFSCQWVEGSFDELIQLLGAQGWVTSHVLLRTQEWRYHWTI